MTQFLRLWQGEVPGYIQTARQGLLLVLNAGIMALTPLTHLLPPSEVIIISAETRMSGILPHRWFDHEFSASLPLLYTAKGRIIFMQQQRCEGSPCKKKNPVLMFFLWRVQLVSKCAHIHFASTTKCYVQSWQCVQSNVISLIATYIDLLYSLHSSPVLATPHSAGSFCSQ